MSHPIKIHFVIADGAHARWVLWTAEGNDFKTVREHKAGHRPHDVVAGNGLEASEAPLHAGAAFTQELADDINAQAVHNHLEKLAIVAPARTLSAVTDHLGHAAKGKLVRTLAKDLVKTPDHELGKWLTSLELI